MSKNIIDYKKMDELRQNINFSKENILSDIEKLKQQIEILSQGYKDKAALKVYDILVNQKMVSLKKGCNKIDKMNEVLNDVVLAYNNLEDRIMSISYKENG